MNFVLSNLRAFVAVVDRCSFRAASKPRHLSQQAEAASGADLPQFVRDEFDAFLECGMQAHGFLRLRLRLRCSDCGHDRLVAFSCKRRRFCPSCGARRMDRTSAHLVDHVIPLVLVRQWVRVCQVRLPIPPSPGTVSPLD